MYNRVLSSILLAGLVAGLLVSTESQSAPLVKAGAATAKTGLAGSSGSQIVGTPRPIPYGYFKATLGCEAAYRGHPITPDNLAPICSNPASPGDIDYTCWQSLKLSCEAMANTRDCIKGTASGSWCNVRNAPTLRPSRVSSWGHRAVDSVLYGSTMQKNQSVQVPYFFDDFFVGAAAGTYLAGLHFDLEPILKQRGKLSGLNGVPFALMASQGERVLGPIQSCSEYVFRKYYPYSAYIEDVFVASPREGAELILGSGEAWKLLYGKRLGTGTSIQAMGPYPTADVEFKGNLTNGVIDDMAACMGAYTQNALDAADTQDEALLFDESTCWAKPYRAYPMFQTSQLGKQSLVQKASEPDFSFQIGDQFESRTNNFEDLQWSIPYYDSIVRNAFLQQAPTWLNETDPALLQRFNTETMATYSAALLGNVPGYIYEPKPITISGVAANATDIERNAAAYADLKAAFPDMGDLDWLEIDARERNYLKLIEKRDRLLSAISCLARGQHPDEAGVCDTPNPDIIITGDWSAIDEFVSPLDMVSNSVLTMVRDRAYANPSGTGILPPVVSMIDPLSWEIINPGALVGLRGIVDMWHPKSDPGVAKTMRPALAQQRMRDLAQRPSGAVQPFVYTGAANALSKGSMVNTKPGVQLVTPLNTAIIELKYTEYLLTEALRYEFDLKEKGCVWMPDGNAPSGPAVPSGDNPAQTPGLAKAGATAGKTIPAAQVARRTNLNVCDWTPRKFGRSFTSALRSDMENDFQECRSHTADDFNALKPSAGGNPKIVPATWSDSNTSGGGVDFRESVPRVFDYIHLVQDTAMRKQLLDSKFSNWVKKSPVMKMPLTGEDGGTSIGHSMHHGETIGDDSTFAVTYSFDAGWKLRAEAVGKYDVEASLNRPVISNLEATTNSGFSVDLSIFGMHPDKKLVESTLEAKAAGSAKRTGYMKILGVKQSLDTDTKHQAFEDNADQEQKLLDFSVSAPFVIVVVPVTLSAGMSATTGIHAGFRGDPSVGDAKGDKQLSLSTELRPWIRADAWGAVAIDALFVEIGARIDLNLATVSVPTLLNVDSTQGAGSERETPKVAGVSVFPNNTITVERDTTVNVDALAGSVSLYAEICYLVDCSKAELTVFSWEGLHQSTTLSTGKASFAQAALGWRLFGVRCVDENGADYDSVDQAGLACHTPAQVMSP